MSPSSDLSFTTNVEPAGRFEIDDIEYDLRDADSLTGEEEGHLLGLFHKSTRLSKEADAFDKGRVTDEKKVKALFMELRSVREEILVQMTSMSPEVAKTLGIRSQNILLREIGKILRLDADEKEQEPGEVRGDD